MKRVIIVGAGLAGSEAAWQVARRGVQVTLYEMRPHVSTPAHHTAGFAELVCSNSLRAASLENAVGLLKEEMRRLNSLVMEAADVMHVPAGGALAVDREGFSAYITDKLSEHPNIEVRREEVQEIPQAEDAVTIIASGPLTAGALAADISQRIGGNSLYFYDAAAPIVTADSIDMNTAFRASRYHKGTADYLNCPMDEATYRHFWQELTHAETAKLHDFEASKVQAEKEIYFEGCMPVEVMAARGEDTLLFGPLKPVGLQDPRTNVEPFAVVQLRQDNAAATLYNLVGFQTRLKWPEQKRVFRLIPGLENAEFVRLGVMHRNTFLNSRRWLLPTLQFRPQAQIFFAGQMTGVEGYVESAASGLIAGINAARLVQGQEPIVFPPETAHGAMAHYITTGDDHGFQPMNANFGLFPPLSPPVRGKKRERKLALARKALDVLDDFQAQLQD